MQGPISWRKSLYKKVRESFQLPSYVDQRGNLVLKRAARIPMVHWPDGRQCVEANLFLLGLYKKGRSIRSEGGTLTTYASQITHLIRYCAANNIHLEELTDAHFTMFINGLRAERHGSSPQQLARNNTTVISIGKVCLDFLLSVGNLHLRGEFISPTGQISAHKEVYLKQTGISRSGQPRIKRIEYWTHSSFGTPEPEVVRDPISTEAIRALRKAIFTCGSGKFLVRRRQVMLKLFEILGGRRTEVSLVTVASVEAAASMKRPMLELQSLKQGGNSSKKRMVPISLHDAKYLLSYVRFSRSVVISRTCGKELDDGFMLISEETGKRLMPNTLTQEMSAIRKAAGISEKACLHMFRHRFITKVFVALIEEHRYQNVDHFRQALIDDDALKRKLMEWTGHRDPASLTRYIHLAFKEVAAFKKTYSVVLARQFIASSLVTLDEIRTELDREGYKEGVVEKLQALMSDLLSDLDVLQADADDADNSELRSSLH